MQEFRRQRMMEKDNFEAICLMFHLGASAQCYILNETIFNIGITIGMILILRAMV